MNWVIPKVFSHNTKILELTKVYFQILTGFDDRDVKPQVWSVIKS